MAVFSQFSLSEIREEDKEDEGDGDEASEEDKKQSMLKLFFMAMELDEGIEEEEEEISSWTPKSLSPPTTLPL